MNVDEVSNQVRDQLREAGFQVLPSVDPKGPHLVGVMNNIVYVIDYLTNAETLPDDIDSARYRLSQIKNRLENSNFRVELEQIFLVLFHPDSRDLVALEKARNDLSLTRRRIAIAGDPNQTNFKAILRDRIASLTAYGNQGRVLELEPPLDRLESELSDRTSRELLVAFRRGGVPEMRRMISAISGAP